MIVTLPYLPQVTDYKQLATDLRKRGPLPHHTLRVISRADDADAAYDLGRDLEGLFDKVSTQGVPVEEGTGMIGVTNAFFFAAMTYLHAQKPPAAGEQDSVILLYYDPLYRPTRNTWLKDLQSAYFYAGAPQVFGQPGLLPDGQTKVFKGPVVFSRGFPLRSALVNYLNPTEHWRVYLRSEMFLNFAETDLIGTTSEAVLKPLPPKKK
jgi:hypothetical protein